jgi:CheY-like chemotaxis protein
MIRDSARRGATLTRQLLAFGRRQVLETRVINLNVILADVEKLLRRVIGEDIELEFQTEGKLGSIEADPGQLEQVIVNLAINARDAMPDGGKLTITTANLHLDETYADRRAAVKPGHYVQVVVSDTGCGMDEQTQSRIFEPFFTTKEQGKGTGLGLATVYGIVKQSGGYVWVYSEPGHGTAFKIYLPMIEAAAESPRYVERNEELPRGSETILVVEDDDLLREVTCEFLQSSGYIVIQAASPEEALHLAEWHNGPIEFLLTDVIMPKMNGRELATRLNKARPEMRVLYVSGYTDGVVRDGVHGKLEEGLAFLQKPYTRQGLTRKVREILDSQRVKARTALSTEQLRKGA